MSPGFAAAAEALGQRARKAAGTDAGRMHWLWQACTGRVPSEQTVQQLQVSHNDYVELADGNEEQAWAALCNVMLNLDATLTLE